MFVTVENLDDNVNISKACKISEVKGKHTLCLMKHHALKTYEEVEV
jgi:hypothetical protein